MNDAQARAVMTAYIAKHGLVRHQQDSFQYFCGELLPLIVQENSTVTATAKGVSHKLSYNNVYVPRPVCREVDGFTRSMHSPCEAIYRGMTYSAPVLVDVTHEEVVNGTRRLTSFKNMELCRIPIMVKSRYCATSVSEGAQKSSCAHEMGGFFVINANEKGMISQEKLAVNVPFVWPGRSNSKIKYVCEIRSCHHYKLRSTSTLYINIREHGSNGLPDVTVQLPFVDVAVPLIFIFVLLDAKDEEQIQRCICNEEDHEMAELLSVVLRHDESIKLNKDDIVDWIARRGTSETDSEKRLRYVQHILSSEVLPHQGLTSTPHVLKQKRFLFGIMVRRLLSVYLGREEVDERDNYGNKRVDTAGYLCSLLFRQLFRHYLKSQQTMLQKCAEGSKPVDIPANITGRKITAGLNYGFATGSWGVNKGGSATQGVCQLINRNSFVAAMANLRRINTPVNKDSKSASVRQLNASSWGIVCPTETPEGQACGLTKNLALLAHVRVGCPHDIPDYAIRSCSDLVVFVDDVDEPPQNKPACFVNGILYGWTSDANVLIHKLREFRRRGALPFDATVTTVRENVILNTDPGALCRPVFVTKHLPRLQSLIDDCEPMALFERLKAEGVVEYLEKLEEIDFKIAVNYEQAVKHDCAYMEIHPSAILGLCASLISCCEFNQSPRNTYQSAMGKQSCGTWASNYLSRHDTVAYSLCYPQKPLVHTWTDEAIGLNKLPAGQNMLVAVGCYGYNMEDSIIINQSFIDRGGGRAYVYRSHSEQESPSGNDVFKLELPETDIVRKHANYEKLNARGVVDVNVVVDSGDAIIGKTVESYVPGSSERVKKDCSHVQRHRNGVVDHIVHTRNKDGMPMVRLRTRSLRKPMVGDKFTSRHGQKGICGKIVPSEDMPYSLLGYTPDIIVNPHCIPSRMTVGHLMEATLGTAAIIEGYFADGTPFRNISIRDLTQKLGNNFGPEHGVDDTGNMRMVCGKTGDQLQDDLSFGWVHYQRLKHMSADKMHARQRGPVALQTKQPLEGRSRDGGLRFGEMESNCVQAEGATAFLQERLFYQSDPTQVPVCQTCGLIAEAASTGYQPKNMRASLHCAPYCRNCDSHDSVVTVAMPYSWKLFLQELYTLHVAPRMRVCKSLPVI